VSGVGRGEERQGYIKNPLNSSLVTHPNDESRRMSVGGGDYVPEDDVKGNEEQERERRNYS
jgi:hypothetical protein